MLNIIIKGGNKHISEASHPVPDASARPHTEPCDAQPPACPYRPVLQSTVRHACHYASSTSTASTLSKER